MESRSIADAFSEYLKDASAEIRVPCLCKTVIRWRIQPEDRVEDKQEQETSTSPRPPVSQKEKRGKKHTCRLELEKRPKDGGTLRSRRSERKDERDGYLGRGKRPRIRVSTRSKKIFPRRGLNERTIIGKNGREVICSRLEIFWPL